MKHRAITDLPSAEAMVRFRPEAGQRFIVTVDTEEEFDWGRPLTREGFGLDHVARLEKFQEFCEGQQVVPLYLVDYPVATSQRAMEILRAPLAAGKAEIGVQLHPWVSPPFEEDVCEFNSFSGNLPESLERRKFTTLRQTIADNFGVAPLSYRAGRYGVGPNTVPILTDNGIAIDTSARARFDYSATGGANFRDLPVSPWWLDDQRQIMEMPLTTVFWGPLRKFGPTLYPALWRIPRMRGLLSRINLLERIPLTPEGTTVRDLKRGIDVAVKDGLPILVFSFHSPSLAPGHTPYVRSEDDLDTLYDWWRTAFSYARAKGVTATNIAGIMQSVELA